MVTINYYITAMNFTLEKLIEILKCNTMDIFQKLNVENLLVNLILLSTF